MAVPKPPLGVIPRDLWRQKTVSDRVGELIRAIVDSHNAGVRPKPEWIDELRELAGTVGDMRVDEQFVKRAGEI